MPQFPVNPMAYYTTGEVAKFFDVSAYTVVSWIERKVLKAIRPGGPGTQYRVLGSEMLRLAQDGQPPEEKGTADKNVASA